MTTPVEGALPAPELQFDQAERVDGAAPAQASCAACRAPIAAEYHVLNGSVICTRCRHQFEATRTEGHARLPQAVLFGIGAAVLGAILYVGVVAITGYEIGIIAIAVGWLVGKAVSKGSGGVGGPMYQWIAVGLTYLSILSLYALPALAEGSAGGIVSLLLLPFTQGFGNAIGILIIGIGLWEAWSLNRAVEIALTGPYQVKPAAAADGVAAGV